ncbi:hypothetical protein AB1Y20_009561 [Prymnesium parvum]|uniref:Uncharacterized protein n=1 Tax=Prymnesium parvum TaxID=97485 RepID=A0AB34K496_PRYPA
MVGATPPRPPTCLGNGHISSKRRAAIDFLARELKTLEIEASHTAHLEQQLEILQAELKQARAAAEFHMRRCDMLELQLRNERALRSQGDSEGASEAPEPDAAPSQEAPVPRAPISLGAAAAMLPAMPACMGPPNSSYGNDEVEDDIDALIEAQRTLPISCTEPQLRPARQPLRLRPGTKITDAPAP